MTKLQPDSPNVNAAKSAGVPMTVEECNAFRLAHLELATRFYFDEHSVFVDSRAERYRIAFRQALEFMTLQGRFLADEAGL